VAKLTLSASRTTARFGQDTLLFRGRSREVLAEIPNYSADFTQEKLSANLSVTHKLSARDRVSAGAIVDLLRYQYGSGYTYPMPSSSATPAATRPSRSSTPSGSTASATSSP
jgi:hypothetical protein